MIQFGAPVTARFTVLDHQSRCLTVRHDQVELPMGGFEMGLTKRDAWPFLAAFLIGGCGSQVDRPLSDAQYERIDGVIAEMERRYLELKAECDHRALFALVYLRTTEQYRIAAEEIDFFRDPSFVADEDVAFAQLYFNPFDAWEKQELAEVPAVWQLAFRESEAHNLTTFGDLLLGVSAHINRDLPFALVEVGLTNPVDGHSRKRDHDKVNDFLARVEVTEEIARDLDPDFTADYAAGLPFIEAWRESAWQWAVRLEGAQNATERASIIEELEQEALETSSGLQGLYELDPGEDTAVRDAHCRMVNEAAQ